MSVAYILNLLNAIPNIYQGNLHPNNNEKKSEEEELLQSKMLKLNCENKENFLYVCMRQTARNDIYRKL